MLLPKSLNIDESNNNLLDKIKSDLAAVLEEKGLGITNIRIDVQADNLNLHVYVGNGVSRSARE